MNIRFVFLAATVITIFASGSVLMGLISTGTKTASPEVSDTAADYSGTFLTATVLFAILAIAAMMLLGNRRAPF